jgi:hypothetical protein
MSRIAALKNSVTSNCKVTVPSKKPIDWDKERAIFIARRDLDRVIWLHGGRLVSQEKYEYRLDVIIKAMAEDSI